VTEVIYTRGENPDYSSAPIQPRVATLMSMCQEVLARLRNVAAEAGIKLPDRQFVHMTTAPLDCEQVAVVFNGWVGEPAVQDMVVCTQFRWCAQIGVAISRCTPAIPGRTSAAPKVEQMNAAAQIASDDAELLIALAMGFGEFGADLNITAQEPEGGYQAVTLSVRLPAFGGLG
jgi:hypothetical protein